MRRLHPMHSVIKRCRTLLRGVLLICLLAVPVASSAADAPAAPLRSDPADWKPLVQRLEADGMDRAYVESVFGAGCPAYDPQYMGRKLNALIRSRTEPKKADEVEPDHHERYLTPLALAGGFAYMREHRVMLAEVQERYGVPPEVMSAFLLVETQLGLNLGKYKALQVLASMANTRELSEVRSTLVPAGSRADLQPWLEERLIQKSDWAYREVKALLEYARRNGLDVNQMPASYYGAIGICQFMPTNAIAYGADGDGDRKVDLFSRPDAVNSMANFLKLHGWKAGLDDEAQLKVFYRYNHSKSYSKTILLVSEALREINNSFQW